MKKIFFLLLLMGLTRTQAQENIADSIQRHTQIFSLSPMSKKVDKVNGLVLGLGHVDNKNVENQVINGLNVEANPAPAAGALYAFIALMYFDEVIKNNKIKIVKDSDEDYLIKNMKSISSLKLNGLNVSSGCFFVETNMNGLNISAGNKFSNFNGLSITVLGTIADHQNGIAVGLCNVNNDLSGSTVGLYNQSYDLKGLHIGVFNQTRMNHGLQIGIFNKSNSKGFQLGVWNVNNKRSMPFLNW